MNDHNKKYPIGPYKNQRTITSRDILLWIDEIKQFPERLQPAVSFLSDDQLDTSYRKGAWTIRQLVHHIADAHLNGYTRIKLTLTEDQPTIKPYVQDSWAILPDSTLPVDSSLHLLKGLHERWAYLLSSLDENQLNRECIHTKSGPLVLKNLIGLYAWHGNHHLAQITTLKKQKNWN